MKHFLVWLFVGNVFFLLLNFSHKNLSLNWRGNQTRNMKQFFKILVKIIFASLLLLLRKFWMHTERRILGMFSQSPDETQIDIKCSKVPRHGEFLRRFLTDETDFNLQISTGIRFWRHKFSRTVMGSRAFQAAAPRNGNSLE